MQKIKRDKCLAVREAKREGMKIMVGRFLFMSIVAIYALCRPVYATTLFDCEYKFFSSDLLQIEAEDFALKFIVDDDGNAFMVGNAGAESVTPIMSNNGISFIEITPAGSVQTTAIDWSGASSHSRNTLLDSGLVPSQYYGKCVIK